MDEHISNKFKIEIREFGQAPTVDVIIPFSPAHTPEEMLSDAIESVRSQTISSRLIIVRDIHQEGPAKARNQGIKRSKNRYIAFLDADDLWKHKKLERQIELLNETDAGICVEGADTTTDQFIREVALFERVSITPTIMIDTHKINVKFDQDLEHREDHLFAAVAAKESGICFCENLTIVRKHERGLSGTIDFKLENAQRFWDRFSSEIPESKSYEDEYWAKVYIKIGLSNIQERDIKKAIVNLLYSFRKKPNSSPIIYIISIPLLYIYYILKIDKIRKRIRFDRW